MSLELTSSISSQQVLVTGGTRGIGAAIVDQLIDDGYNVWATATSQAGVEQLQAHLVQKGEKHRALLLDVTNTQQCQDVIERITAAGGLHVLINNAGITRDNLAMRMTESDWEQVIQTNLTAVFRLCKLAIRPMVKQRYGRIVNITSVVGATGNAGQSNYAAAKSAVTGMSKALAAELGSRSITVNCVAPGFIETDMTRVLDRPTYDAIVERISLKRLGSAAEVAYVVSFLANPKASYITGTTIHVNGGMAML